MFTAEQLDFKHKVDISQVWAQALYLLEEGKPYWFSYEEMKVLNEMNEIYRQVPPEEEWLQKLYDPCERENPKAKFLMASEILTQINAFSGMRLSLKKLMTSLGKLGFEEPFSKRINGGSSRKVFPVIERKDV